MTNGVLIFAHNNREVDYARMSIVSGGLAKKHLKVPVSLVTDQSTVDWMIESDVKTVADKIFDQIIIIERPQIKNYRNLYDGDYKMNTPFINENRNTAYHITPYARTLLIDSDYFIMSDKLNEYWNINQDVLIGDSILDIDKSDRMGYHDRYVSYTGPKLFWATAVMFTKNKKSEMFFNLVEDIRQNYNIYASLYRFNPKVYRNDISFSLAKHILNGFKTEKEYTLPPILTTIDKDILHKVENNRLYFLIDSTTRKNYYAVSVKSNDIHIMNKKSIVRNFDSLMELI